MVVPLGIVDGPSVTWTVIVPMKDGDTSAHIRETYDTEESARIAADSTVLLKVARQFTFRAVLVKLSKSERTYIFTHNTHTRTVCCFQFLGI